MRERHGGKLGGVLWWRNGVWGREGGEGVRRTGHDRVVRADHWLDTGHPVNSPERAKTG